MTLPIYQVDAFTSKLFAGNPAAIVPLTEWLPDSLLQSIAQENNLAETAYFVPNGEAYHLRWFTPAVEVDLCGHATLAAALVLMECLGYTAPRIDFDTRSGRLTVTREDGRYWLDFPARPPVEIDLEAPIREGIGAAPVAALKARDHLLVYETQAEVAALNPNYLRMAETEHFAVIATAPGEDCDFVSRFFAPRQGINEDPVTGSAHCTLTPYWAQRLGKTTLSARQISSRGGELQCELLGDRVRIGGYGVLYLRGEIEVA
ncbi:MAG: PhzF family phenazine biosynthesis protein [Acidobacteria bacterium]|nr:PhzF family phenazine biosynthesis protein [Acidobacteriota bacterium]